MSDEERKMHAKENDEDTGADDDDVDAHVRGGRQADGSDDDGDDVEAHVRSGR